MKIIGYTRVSTVKQANDGDSLELQRGKLATYCDLHDYELVDVYEDAGESGKDMNRDGLRAALDAVERGEADGLVVYKLDRLTRSTADLGRLLERFENKGVALKAVAESLDTDTAAGRMVVRMLGVVAEWERETIGERTSAALQAKAAKGEYTGGKIPFGYALADDGRMLVERADEQAILEDIRKLQSGGLSLRAIADELNERGCARRNGNDWHHVAVSRVLKGAA
ncbi:MAG: recombinase family protein [Trueperaceae bacterium]|nr:recombinase family protein [Trueperaceae bacterium]